MRQRNNERTQRSVRFLMNSLEILFLTAVFGAVWFYFFRRYVYYYFWGNYLVVALYAAALITFNSMYEGFQLGFKKTGDLIFSQLIALVFANLLIFLQVTLTNKHALPLGQFFFCLAMEILLVVVANVVLNRIYYSFFPPRETWLIMGSEEDASVYQRIMRNQANAYRIVRQDRFETIKDQLDQIQKYDCILACGLSLSAKERLTAACYVKNKNLYLLPDIYDVIVGSARNVYLVDTPILKLNNFGPSQIAKIVKRLWDILFALFFILLTSPIMLITALLIKLEDGGPIFYRQTRLTQYGRPFAIIKFRSMRIDAEKDGIARLASEHDERITHIGKTIRALRIDELPQLLNILKGDMSVVGPRPERPEIVRDILKTLPEFDYRLKVKAGLTGYAQVYGKYNTRLRDKLLFDLLYIEKFSILLDIRIMFMTFKILFIKDSTEGVDDGQIMNR